VRQVPERYVRFKVYSNSTRNNNTWSTVYDYQLENGSSLFNFSDPELGFWLAEGSEDELPWENISGWAMVSAGYSHTCGITARGALLCWGQGKNGQALVPQWAMASNDTVWTSVSAGTSHTCGITANGSAVCWGANDEGQTQVPDVQDQTWKQISAVRMRPSRPACAIPTLRAGCRQSRGGDAGVRAHVWGAEQRLGDLLGLERRRSGKPRPLRAGAPPLPAPSRASPRAARRAPRCPRSRGGRRGRAGA
jgi:hypothetical protein